MILPKTVFSSPLLPYQSTKDGQQPSAFSKSIVFPGLARIDLSGSGTAVVVGGKSDDWPDPRKRGPRWSQGFAELYRCRLACFRSCFSFSLPTFLTRPVRLSAQICPDVNLSHAGAAMVGLPVKPKAYPQSNPPRLAPLNPLSPKPVHRSVE